MSLYGRIFAAGYDRFQERSERAGIAERRRRQLAPANGRVVELGAGTGKNLLHYPDSVEEVVLTEPEEPMARRLERRLRETGRPGRVVRAPAEALPFEDGSFDTAVATWVLCTVKDPDRVLAELRRVLRPGGRFLFLEHVRAADPKVARWQDRLHGLWLRFGHGCHCNRPTLATLERSSFELEHVEEGTVPHAPAIIRPLVMGRAVAPARRG